MYKAAISLLQFLVVCLIAYGTQADEGAGRSSSSSSSSSVGSESAISLPGAAIEPEATVRWIEDHGGQVNVVVRHTPDSGRAVFTTREFEKGDVLASIPFELCYIASKDVTADVQFTALKFLEDLADPGHSHQQYFGSLPARDGVWSMHDIPKTYLPLIQSKEGALEKAIADFQDRLQLLWDKINSAAALPGTFSDLKYATAQLMTRLFQFEGVGLVMIPLVDMGNHRNDCHTSHIIEACPFNPERRCMVWRAGSHISEGGEVCNHYKFMLNDRSLLQYGFLQTGGVAGRLSGVDRHDFNTSQPWQDLPGGENGPMLFEGTPEEVRDEIRRLKQLKTTLQQGQDQLDHISVDTADPGGWFLEQLLLWRQQRQHAVDKELDRLQRQLRRLERIQDSLGDPSLMQAAYDRLTEWLEAGGAEVNVVMREVPDIEQSVSGSPSCSSEMIQRSAMVATAPSCNSKIVNMMCSSGLTGEALISLETTANGTSAGSAAARRPGVVTRSAVKKGDVLAVIPIALALEVKQGNDGMLETVQNLLLAASNLSKTTNATGAEKDTQTHMARRSISSNNFDYDHETLLAALPKLGQVQGLHNFPEAYLPLINNKPMELHIRALQGMMKKGWDAQRPAIEAADDSITYRELQHYATLVATRSLAYDEGLLLVPLLSLTSPNLSNGCQHIDYIDTCPGSAGVSRNDVSEGNRCIYWVAGDDVAADQEVCLSYGHLFPDIAVLQYGTPQQEAPAGLHVRDRPDFDPEQPFAPAITGSEAPTVFSGTSEQALAEAVRLSLLQAELTRNWSTSTVSQHPAAKTSSQEQLLKLLTGLEEQRIAAIAEELHRLKSASNITHDDLYWAIAEWHEEQLQGIFTTSSFSDAAETDLMAHQADVELDPWRSMISWMLRHGATVNVDVQYASPSSGRIVVAQSDLRRGDLIAAIPLQLTHAVQTQGSNDTFELAAANLWDAMSNPDHPLQPYFKSLPGQDEIICPLVDLPTEYLPLINNKIAVACIMEYQDRISLFWNAYKAELQAELPGMTISDLKYARSLIATRVFKHSTLGDILIPLLDMANHQEGCPHMQTLGPCPADDSQECLLWHAGSNLAHGVEVCNFYKFMSADQSFFQYGFLQANDQHLHKLDRSDFIDSSSFWAPLPDRHPNILDAHAEYGVSEEVERLEAIAHALQQTEVQNVAEYDDTGRVLELMRHWLYARADAINQELRRLGHNATLTCHNC